MRTQILRQLGAVSSLPNQSAAVHLSAFLSSNGEASDAIARPPEFAWHDYAIFLLSMAAEIEHSLMIQYLYAAYSLGGSSIPAQHRPAALEWQRIILGVAKEEMGHLVTVQNVIKLLGGPVHLDREDFPWDSGFYPYPFTLEPASLKTVAKFVVAESPDAWPKDVPQSERDTIEKLALDDAGHQVVRVGKLYETMIRLVGSPDLIADGLFRAETYPYQASWDEWGRGYAAGARGATTTTTPDVLVTRVATRTQAVLALKGVAQQGEALQLINGGTEESHFSRFLHVFRGLSNAKDWNPVIPLPANPVVPGFGTIPGGTVIENPEAASWGTLFNMRYRMLLSWLAHSFQLADNEGPDSAPSRRGQVLNRAFGEMYHLRSIAALMTRLPLADDPSVPAGPPFQLPYTMKFPSMEQDFWRLHLDLLTASRDLLSTLQHHGSGHGAAYALALTRADEEAANEVHTILRAGSKA